MIDNRKADRIAVRIVPTLHGPAWIAIGSVVWVARGRSRRATKRRIFSAIRALSHKLPTGKANDLS